MPFNKKRPMNPKAQAKKASKAKIPLSRLPKAVIPEMKRKDVVIENAQSLVLGQNLGTVTKCFHLEQGPGLEQRIGRRVLARGIHVKGHFYNKPGQPCFFVRMLILQDKENNAATFSGDELFLKAGQPVSHTQGTESAYLGINKARYRVYSDKMMKLASSSNNAENIQIFKTFVKLNTDIRYDGNTFTSITGNNIQIAYFPVNPTGAVITTEKITANYQSTMYYMDP